MMTDQLLWGSVHICKLTSISKCVRQQKEDKRQNLNKANNTTFHLAAGP